MSISYSKDLEIQERRARVARLYLQKELQRDIAETLGIDKSTVSRDLKAIREAWRASALIDIGEAIIRELEALDVIESELWQAWRRSLRKSEKKTHKAKNIAVKIEDLERDNKGRVQIGKDGALKKKKETKIYPLEAEESRTTYERDGDPRWMRLILKVREDRRKLLGLDRERETQDDDALTSFLDALRDGAEAAWSGVAEPEWDDGAEEADWEEVDE